MHWGSVCLCSSLGSFFYSIWWESCNDFSTHCFFLFSMVGGSRYVDGFMVLWVRVFCFVVLWCCGFEFYGFIGLWLLGCMAVCYYGL